MDWETIWIIVRLTIIFLAGWIIGNVTRSYFEDEDL